MVKEKLEGRLGGGREIGGQAGWRKGNCRAGWVWSGYIGQVWGWRGNWKTESWSENRGQARWLRGNWRTSWGWRKNQMAGWVVEGKLESRLGGGEAIGRLAGW